MSLLGCPGVILEFQKSSLDSIPLFALSSPDYVADASLQFREDDLILGHHVHCIEVQQLGSVISMITW